MIGFGWRVWALRYLAGELQEATPRVWYLTRDGAVKGAERMRRSPTLQRSIDDARRTGLLFRVDWVVARDGEKVALPSGIAGRLTAPLDDLDRAQLARVTRDHYWEPK